MVFISKEFKPLKNQNPCFAKSDVCIRKFSSLNIHRNVDKSNGNSFKTGKPRIMSVLSTAPSKMRLSVFERETSPTEKKPYIQAARSCTSEHKFFEEWKE